MKCSGGVMEQVNQGYPKSTSRLRHLRIDSPPRARSALAASTPAIKSIRLELILGNDRVGQGVVNVALYAHA
jgi:hypothetical protein